MVNPEFPEAEKQKPLKTFDPDTVQRPARGFRRLSVCIALILIALPAFITWLEKPQPEDALMKHGERT